MSEYPCQVLNAIKKPSRYLGNEPLFPLKDWNSVRLRVCLSYPDLYEVGRSHLGLNILCSIVNSRPNHLCDLAFAVAEDMEAQLRASETPLLSTNYRRPLAEFDVVGICYAYELTATGILQILYLSKIPIKAEDRDETFPIVLGGGPSTGNPEPLAKVFDAIVIGEAEEALIEVLGVIEEWKKDKRDKPLLLRELSKIEGVYVPFLRNSVRRRIFQGFAEGSTTYLSSIPTIGLSHDRLSVEISRGCTRGCRFCSAGFFYRPVREKSPETILTEILEGFKRTGYREASLMSLSTGDYSRLDDLVALLDKTFYLGKDKGEYAFSLPSLRVGSLKAGLLKFLRKGRATTLTFAVEAGSERLRRVINKDIDLEELFRDLLLATKHGFQRIKVYFMIGLPTEDDDDIKEVVRLYRDLKRIYPKVDLVFSASIFVPKPHTPFQWSEQVDLETARHKIAIFKKALKGAFKHHNPERGLIEGVIARAGQEAFDLIERAFSLGARLDSWTESFRFDVWQRAAKELGIDLKDYLKKRDKEGNLPWDHVDVGVKKDFWLRELHRAEKAKITRDCRMSTCTKCGVCQRVIKNILAWESSSDIAKERTKTLADLSPAVLQSEPKPEYWYLLTYTKRDKARYLSQLEVMRLFELRLRSEGIPLAYTQGFNPRPKMVLGPAIPVGVESEEESLAISILGDEYAPKLKELKIYAGLNISSVKTISMKKPEIDGETMILRLIPAPQVKLSAIETEDFSLKVEDGAYLLVLKNKSLGVLRLLRERFGLSDPLQSFTILRIRPAKKGIGIRE